MNFKKLMIAVAAIVLVIAVWKMMSRVDRSNPVAVATAFTKAMKGKDTSTASAYYLPEKAQMWREQMDEQFSGMKTGTEQRYLERIPDAPQFTPPVTAAGKTVITTGDKAFSLELTQVAGKWYIANF
jgi:hypothetical protein